MEEEIDPESWLTREVYAYFGLAMYAAQVLEHEMVNLIAWTDVSSKGYAEPGEIDAMRVIQKCRKGCSRIDLITA